MRARVSAESIARAVRRLRQPEVSEDYGDVLALIADTFPDGYDPDQTPAERDAE